MFKGNKMLRLGICVLLLSTVFTGCGKGDKGTSAKSGVSFQAEPDSMFYQYEKLDSNAISVSVDGEKYTLSDAPDDWEVKLKSEVILSEQINLSVKGKDYQFSLGDSYVPSDSIDWSYGGSLYIPEEIQSTDDLDKSKLKGTINYLDGKQTDVQIVNASLEVNDAGEYDITINDGLNTFHWETLEEGLMRTDEEVQADLERVQKEQQEKKDNE